MTRITRIRAFCIYAKIKAQISCAVNEKHQLNQGRPSNRQNRFDSNQPKMSYLYFKSGPSYSLTPDPTASNWRSVVMNRNWVIN